MATISYVRIYGPPILKAIRELEKLAVGMPEICIMDTILVNAPELDSYLNDPDVAADYFSSIPINVKVERCSTIISRSGEKLGEYDFFFEWFTKPTQDQINDLIRVIDERLAPLGCKYTLTTKS
ncbi:hypothetical protein ISS40_09880 [Candidatus Bathyarchaeota archaeon]|nr:hypothetical protein [Candidatus Bathyarchaeota archaeon]